MKKFNWLALPSTIVGCYFIYLGLRNFNSNPIFFTVWLLISALTLYRSLCFLLGRTVNNNQETKEDEGQTQTERRLKELEHLYQQGLITRDEFEAKRQQILDEL